MSRRLPTTPSEPERPAAARRTPKVAWRRKSGQLPSLDQLPIPTNARAGKGWTGQMLEMADHVGEYRTLCIVAALGGEQVYVSHSAEHSPFAGIVDAATCRTLAQVYGGYRLTIPVARAAIRRARGAVVIAAVREGAITGAEGAKILGTSRTYLTQLVNSPDEGADLGSIAAARRLPRQMDLFAALLDRRD